MNVQRITHPHGCRRLCRRIYCLMPNLCSSSVLTVVRNLQCALRVSRRQRAECVHALRARASHELIQRRASARAVQHAHSTAAVPMNREDQVHARPARRARIHLLLVPAVRHLAVDLLTYQPNMLTKSLSPTAVWPIEPDCRLRLRAESTCPLCSPYRAVLSGLRRGLVRLRLRRRLLLRLHFLALNRNRRLIHLLLCPSGSGAPAPGSAFQ